MSSIHMALAVAALVCMACASAQALTTTAATPETASLIKFNASRFDGGAAPGAILFSAALDNTTDTMTWNFTFPKGYEGLYALEIRDGKAGSDVLAVELYTPSPAPATATGKQTFDGTFTAAEINTAVAGSARELANHMCMGHIYAVVQVESGAQRAPIGFANPSDPNACYDAIGLGAGHGMGDMGMDGMDGMDGIGDMDGKDDEMPGMAPMPAVSPSPRPSSSSPSPAPPASGAMSLAAGLAAGVAAAVAAVL